MMGKRVFVAGHKGMVGAAVLSRLQTGGYCTITRGRRELDLTQQGQVQQFFESEAIDAVVLAAAKVGGIHANNTYPAEFIYQNLMIQANVVHSAHSAGVNQLVFLGSSCIYPKHAHQPITENALLSGALEPTNEPYAISKIAGIKMCESYNRQYGRDYRSLMPTNLYGPNDNFHPDNSHVLPALIRRFHEAKIQGLPVVTVWGSGNPRREFLHVDDLAAAVLFVLELSPDQLDSVVLPMASHLNVGTGEDCSIRELACLVAEVVGYSGEVAFDQEKPDGTPRKLLDVSKLNSLGWSASISLQNGIANTYDWYLSHLNTLRG